MKGGYFVKKASLLYYMINPLLEMFGIKAIIDRKGTPIPAHIQTDMAIRWRSYAGHC
jgi:hypothetical protein